MIDEKALERCYHSLPYTFLTIRGVIEAYEVARQPAEAPHDHPVHTISRYGCSICGTDALHCSAMQSLGKNCVVPVEAPSPMRAEISEDVAMQVMLNAAYEAVAYAKKDSLGAACRACFRAIQSIATIKLKE